MAIRQARPAGRRLRATAAIFALAAGTLTGLGTHPATAGNFNGCFSDTRTPCFANNSYHTFSINLGPRMAAAVDRTRLDSYETTDMNTARQSTAVDDANEDTYHHFLRNLPEGAIGQYICIYGGASGTCNHAHLRYDDSQIGGFSDTLLTALACHETGHSVGLRHPEEDPNFPNVSDVNGEYQCMVRGGYVDGSKPRFLGGHNAVGHINTRY